MKKIIIFGTSDFARLIHWHVNNDAQKQAVCFCADKDYITESTFLGLPVVPFEDVEKKYSPKEHELILAIGHSKMNDVRKRVFLQAKEKGYKLANYIHPSTIVNAEKLGEGNIILENSLFHPFSVIGDCNLIWCNVTIAHDVRVGSFNTISGSVVFGGYSSMGDNCFAGIQASVFDSVNVADYTLVGSGAHVRRDTDPYSVIVPVRSIVLEGKKSTDFM